MNEKTEMLFGPLRANLVDEWGGFLCFWVEDEKFEWRGRE